MIYFDNSATTALTERVKRAMCDEFAIPSNPSSMHRLGYEAELRLSEARKKVAESLHAAPDEIIFTSGGTEADNLAILGAVRKWRPGYRIVTTNSEHPAVSETLAHLEKEGVEVVYLPTKGGVVPEEALFDAVNEKTVLTAIMHTNNETGAVYDIARLSRAAKEKNPSCLVFCDCVQGYMKSDINPLRLGVDMLSVSSHKIHGPKGAGALWAKRGLRPAGMIFGGGQENGIRSGTENLIGIAGFGEAASEGREKLNENILRMKCVREKIISSLSGTDGVLFNIPENPSCHIVSMQVKGFRSEVLLHILSDMDIFVSSGSACSSHKGKSPVLKNFGLTDEEADRTVRISLSDMNTPEEAEIFAEAIKNILKGKCHGGI